MSFSLLIPVSILMVTITLPSGVGTMRCYYFPEVTQCGLETWQGLYVADNLPSLKPGTRCFFLGLPVDRGLIYSGEFQVETGSKGISALLSLKPPPTAIFTGDAMLTLGALQWIAQQRLVIPDDIAVVSYGDPEWASIVSCPLTVVEQPGYLAGSMAANLLLSRLMDELPDEAQHVILTPRLVIRESHHCVRRDMPAAG